MAYSPKSQKAYNDKCNIVRVKYTPRDNNDYDRLQSYINSNNITVTEYIKALIKTDLDNKDIPYPTDNETD